MIKTLKDLFLALLNATLILLAICLFLGWKLAQSVDDIKTGFAENLQQLSPLREQAEGIRTELAGLRDDLSALIGQTGPLDSAAQQRLAQTLDRLSQIEEKLSGTQARLAGLADNPEALIDYAITTAAETATDQIQNLRGCGPTT